jgi:hypothetical protein
MHHPVTDLLDRTAGGHIPSLKEIRGLNLPPANQRELETAIAEQEHHPDEAKAGASAERLIDRLPSTHQSDNYLDGDQLDPRDLAARLPQT